MNASELFYKWDKDADAAFQEALSRYHRALLSEARFYEVRAFSIDCDHCGRTKQDHASDLRCSTDNLSRTYRPVNIDRQETVKNLIAGIEEIAEVGSFRL